MNNESQVYPRFDELITILKSEGFPDFEIAFRLIEKSIYDLEHGHYPSGLDIEKGKEEFIAVGKEMLATIRNNRKIGLSRKSNKLIGEYFEYNNKRIREL
jgi:hypothetical protein